MIERVSLNRDMLNDSESIFFPINKHEYYKFPTNKYDLIKTIKKALKQLNREGIDSNTIMISSILYTDASIEFKINNDYWFGKSFDDALKAYGINVEFRIMIPDCLKDRCKRTDDFLFKASSKIE